MSRVCICLRSKVHHRIRMLFYEMPCNERFFMPDTKLEVARKHEVNTDGALTHVHNVHACML